MYADDLKYQIERILNWEPSSHWRPRDFVHLSDMILAHTSQHVEAQDLQAFWQSAAGITPSSLNALARFADYSDWDDFCTRNFYGSVDTDDELAVMHAPMWEIPMRWVIILCWLSVIASILVAVLLVWKR